jgi:hypothetical protein
MLRPFVQLLTGACALRFGPRCVRESPGCASDRFLLKIRLPHEGRACDRAVLAAWSCSGRNRVDAAAASICDRARCASSSCLDGAFTAFVLLCRGSLRLGKAADDSIDDCGVECRLLLNDSPLNASRTMSRTRRVTNDVVARPKKRAGAICRTQYSGRGAHRDRNNPCGAIEAQHHPGLQGSQARRSRA